MVPACPKSLGLVLSLCRNTSFFNRLEAGPLEGKWALSLTHQRKVNKWIQRSKVIRGKREEKEEETRQERRGAEWE